VGSNLFRSLEAHNKNLPRLQSCVFLHWGLPFNLACRPPQFGLQVDVNALIMYSNGSTILPPNFGFCSHFSIDLVWCLNLRSPDEWLQEAGGAVQQGRLAGFHVASNGGTRTYALRPCSMHGCLTRKTSSIAPDSQLLQSRITSCIDQIERHPLPSRAGSQLLREDHNYIEMAFFSNLDDMRSLRMKIDQKDYDLFKEKPGQALLTVTRVFKSQQNNTKFFEKDRKVSKVSDVRMLRNVSLHLNSTPAFQSRQYFKVIAFEHTTGFSTNTNEQETNDASQIFTINQDRSWTTLNTSRDVFESFMSAYNVMPPFWKYIFTFGRKSEENEFEFPKFGQRRTRNPNADGFTQGYSDLSPIDNQKGNN
jgi:hypothetical protein